MSDKVSEHNPATDPPGVQSDQNGEDAQSGHREDGTHPEPRTSGKQAEKHEQRSDPRRGGASEGSQATGHRDNAG